MTFVTYRPADRRTRPQDHPCDLTRCTPTLASVLTSYTQAKCAHDFDRMNEHFDQSATVYADAVGGWVFRSNDEFRQNWATAVPEWPAAAMFYNTRAIGDDSGGIVFVVDTPQMLGREIRGIAVVDVAGGRFVRWVDYWDSRPLGPVDGAQAHSTPLPDDFGESTVTRTAPKAVDRVAQGLHAALTSGDHEAAAALFAVDGVFEDHSLRLAVRGREAIDRYLARAGTRLPYAAGAHLRHVVGGEQGGGYEWRTTGRPVLCGVTALDLDESGAITSLAAIWDTFALDDDAMTAMTALSVDPLTRFGD